MNRTLRIIYRASDKGNGCKPTELEHRFVYDTYDAISQHFDHTRFAKWPKVRKFITSLQKGAIVCDLGCGNGKYLNQNDCFMIGLDRSLKLLQIIKQKDQGLAVLAGDALKVPIRSQSCDAVLSIALLHHLSTWELRLQALKEVARILKTGGRGLVYVWCSEQQIKHKQPLPEEYYQKLGYLNREQDMFVRWHLQSKFHHNRQQKSQESNIVLVKRYYHLFNKGELEELTSEVTNLQILRSEYDNQNWCVEVKKRV